MRIEVTGLAEVQTTPALDEIAPKWWNGADYGRADGVLWVEGKDRLIGGAGPEEFREDLERKLQQTFGRQVRVSVSGRDLEGVELGRKFKIP